MATRDGVKTGGRKKGVVNKKNQLIQDLIQELNCDPIAIMCHIANDDWEKLGYDSPMTSKWTSAGIEYEERAISIDQRLSAAKELSGYLHSKKKSIEGSITVEIVDTLHATLTSD